jgi:hypothetical protein
MVKVPVLYGLMLCGILAVPMAHGSAITGDDSTQPRGDAGGLSADGHPLDPIQEGFRAPAKAYNYLYQQKLYSHYMGSMMNWSARDPAFFAELASSNRDVIEYINSIPGDPTNASSPLGAFLTDMDLFGDITRDTGTGRLVPEEKLPVVADICLRCHVPVGWMEGHSEPATLASPHLNGQFWGAAFLEESVGNPVDVAVESEAEMEGIQCDFCHRAIAQETRASLFDGSPMAKGNGSFFVHLDDIFGPGDFAKERTRPIEGLGREFQATGNYCGTCHDVTNPIVDTATVVDGAVPVMRHPIERTYTEWYWSAFRTEGVACQACHQPMKFQGAQTWMLFPAMNALWKDLDQKWVDRGYDVPSTRDRNLALGRARNLSFMETAATMTVGTSGNNVNEGDNVTVNVEITNDTGHKLPTGFAEGRQMWVYIRVLNAQGQTIYEDGALDANGFLNRTPDTKVYERVGSAQGYAASVVAPGEEHFRFALENTVEKDNRIPPRGYIKAAYQADGAFIIPENSYGPGQNTDTTNYQFQVPTGTAGSSLNVRVELRYQTFGREYVDFLRSHGDEPTVANGGRARNLPDTGFVAWNNLTNWGEAIYQLWDKKGGRGTYVVMESDEVEIVVEP